MGGDRFGQASRMSGIRKLPAFEQTISAVLLEAKESTEGPMRPKLREFKISEPQWRVMRVINDRGESDITGLAETGHFHPPSVTRIVQELEERLLVMRQPDPDDGRRILVSLTPEGRDIVKAVSRQMTRIMREYTTRFGAQRLDRLIDELRALSASIKGVE
jgi:homoprotocatechuate degradation regulator HpaR